MFSIMVLGCALITLVPGCSWKHHKKVKKEKKLSNTYSVQAIMDNAYTHRSGFGISQEETSFIREHGGAPTYGEITYEAAEKLLHDLDLTKQDVFYDLGSGVGKLVVHAYLATPVKKSVGIELSKTRYDKAQEVKELLHQEGYLKSHKTLAFKHQNILDADLHDATVVYMCSTCYSEDLMEKLVKKFSKLKRGLRIVTLKELPRNKQFKLIHTYHLPMTWSARSSVYVYKMSN